MSGLMCLMPNSMNIEVPKILEGMSEELLKSLGIEDFNDEALRYAMYRMLNSFWVSRNKDSKALSDIEGFINHLQQKTTLSVPKDTYEKYERIYNKLFKLLTEDWGVPTITSASLEDAEEAKDQIVTALSKILAEEGVGWNVEKVFRDFFLCEVHEKDQTFILRKPKANDSLSKQQQVLNELQKIKHRVERVGFKWAVDGNVIDSTSVSKLVHPDEHAFPTLAAYLGNRVDTIARWFFDKSSPVWKDGKLILNAEDKETKDYLQNLIDDHLDSAFTIQGFLNLLNDFKMLNDQINAIWPDCVVVSADFKMAAKSNTGNWVIGATDLIVVDSKGKLHVLDIKTKRVSNAAEYDNPFASEPRTMEYGQSYNRQLYYYIKLLRSHGFEVDSTPYLVICDTYYDSSDMSYKGVHTEGEELYSVTKQNGTEKGRILEGNQTLGDYAEEHQVEGGITKVLDSAKKKGEEGKEEGDKASALLYIEPRLHINRETGNVNALLERPSIDDHEQRIAENKNKGEKTDKLDEILDFINQFQILDDDEKTLFEKFAGRLVVSRPVGRITALSNDDIQSTTLMSSNELSFLAEATMYEVQDLLDKMAKGRTIKVKHLETEALNDGKKTKGKSHAEIIKMIGINKLIKYAFEHRFGKEYDEAVNFIDTSEMDPDLPSTQKIEKAKLTNEKITWIRDHFSQFKVAGLAKLMALEDTVIPVKKRNRSAGTVQEETPIDGNKVVIDCGDNAEVEALLDKIMDGLTDPESWTIGRRNFSPKASLAQEIAKLFERLWAYDVNGNMIQNPYGWSCNMRMDSTTAIQMILETCMHCDTEKEMEDALNGLMTNPENSWLNNIMTKLNDPKNESLKKKFYRHFRKDFNVYSHCDYKIENGKVIIYTRVVNLKSAYDVMTSSLGKEYENGRVGTWAVQIGNRTEYLPVVQRNEEGKNVLTKFGDNFITKEIQNEIDKTQNVLQKLYNTAKSKGTNKEERIAVFRKLLLEKDSNGIDFIDKISNILKAVGVSIQRKVLIEYCASRMGNNPRRDPAGLLLSRVRGVTENLESQFAEEKQIPNGLGGNKAYAFYQPLLSRISEYVREHVEASTYDNGKTYYSYSYPSKLQYTIRHLSDVEDQTRFEQYLQDNYGRYVGWFKDKDGNWLNDWIEQIATGTKAKEALAHKIELAYIGQQYKNLGPLAFQLSILHNYFGSTRDTNINKNYRWFAMTTMSNKPTNEFIRMLKYASRYSTIELDNGDEIEVNEEIVDRVLMKTFKQECNRIADVLWHYSNNDIGTEWMDIDQGELDTIGITGLKERIDNRSITAKDLQNLSKTSSGAKFHFLWYLNDEIKENKELAESLAKSINLLLTPDSKNKTVDRNEQADTLKEVKLAIEKRMAKVVDAEMERLEEMGLLDKVSEKNGRGETEERMKWQDQFAGNLGARSKDDPTGERSMREALRDFLWQDIAANINIIQITGGDLALYGNPANYQKRIAQVHSPGLPLMHDEKYDDGYIRSIFISDIEHYVSEIVANAEAYLDEYIESYEGNKEELEREKTFILNLLSNVDVTDGQSYNCPTSIRKKMRIQGEWTDELEEAYNRIKTGNFDINDLKVIIQPSKPFVTAELAKYSGSPSMQMRRRTIQAKNSEYLILLADALSTASGKRSKMAAIHDFMEQSVKENGETRGIDTVHFKSVGKVGVTGVVDMNAFDEEFEERLDKGTEYENGNEKFNTLVKYYLNKNNKTTLQEEDYNALLTEYLMMHVRRHNNKGLPSVQEQEDFDTENRLVQGKDEDGNDIDKVLKEGEVVYNSEFVDAVPIEGYIIQQEIPAHLLEHEQLYGSQPRILGISDITPGTVFNVNGEEMPDHTTSINGEEKKGLIEEYKELHAANIKQAYEELKKELGIDKLFDADGNLTDLSEADPDVRDEILINLEYMLQRELSRDMKYGLDIRRACTLQYKDDGHVDDFITPLMDPVQSTRIQQLLNSIIKKTINKQKINGGSVVQVTAYDNDLHIVFQNKEGKLLPTLSEFEGKWVEKHGTPENWEKKMLAAFKEEVCKEQAGIAYFECYASVPNKTLETLITKADGSLMTPKEVQDTMPEVWEAMSKMIGYRIPTEAKYSMIPLKIVGFLPKGSGQAIMMPKEITRLTGSDFDIDKIYLMMKEFALVSSDIFRVQGSANNILDDFIDGLRNAKNPNMRIKEPSAREKELLAKVLANIIQIMDENADITLTKGVSFENDKEKEEFIKNFVEPARSYVLSKAFKEHTDYSEKAAPVYAKAARNNRILDLQWAVLTNKDTAPKMLSPGNFEDIKRVGRIIKIRKSEVKKANGQPYTDKELNDLYNNTLKKQGYKKAIAVLDNLIEEGRSYNITLPSSKIYFQRQNMQGTQLVGTAANNNVSHAFCSFQNIALDLQKKGQDNSFALYGHTLGDTSDPKNPESFTRVDPQRRFDGGLVSDTLAKILAAAVDTAKDSCLKDSNIDTFTAGVAMTMARLGFNFEEIGMFLSQPIIVDLSDTYFSMKADNNYVTGDNAIREVATIMEYDIYGQESVKSIQDTNVLTMENLKKHIVDMEYSDNDDQYDFQMRVLKAFSILFNVSKKMQELTFLTKYNSTSNAVGPTIADTEEDMQKVEKFENEIESDCFYFPDGKSIEEGGLANYDFTIAQDVVANDPILEAFFECTVGENGAARAIFSHFFPHYFPGFKNILDHFKQNYTRQGKVSSKLHNQLLGDYMYFLLTYDNILLNSDGNSGSVLPHTKEDLYDLLINTPKLFQEVLKLKEKRTRPNGLIDGNIGENCIFLKEASEFLKMDTLVFNSGQLSSEVAEKVKDDWNELVTMNDPNLDEEDIIKIRRLGIDLFLYNLTRNAFGFHPKTMMHLATVLVRMNALFSGAKDSKGRPLFVNYLDGLRAIKDLDKHLNEDVTFKERFCSQFARNHSNIKSIAPQFGKENILISDESTRDQIVFSVSEKDRNKLNAILIDDKKACQFVSVIWKNFETNKSERLLYKLVSSPRTDYNNNISVIYERVPMLGVTNKFIEYDANSDLQESFFEDKRVEIAEDDLEVSEADLNPDEDTDDNLNDTDPITEAQILLMHRVVSVLEDEDYTDSNAKTQLRKVFRDVMSNRKGNSDLKNAFNDFLSIERSNKTEMQKVWKQIKQMMTEQNMC